MPLEGLTFVITGALPKSRKEVEDLIEANGGHAASAVSASTSFLVAGEDPAQNWIRQSHWVSKRFPIMSC